MSSAAERCRVRGTAPETECDPSHFPSPPSPISGTMGCAASVHALAHPRPVNGSGMEVGDAPLSLSIHAARDSIDPGTKNGLPGLLATGLPCVSVFKDRGGKCVFIQARDSWPHRSWSVQQGPKPWSKVQFTDPRGEAVAVLLNGPSGNAESDSVANRRPRGAHSWGYQNGEGRSVLCVPKSGAVSVVQPDGEMAVATTQPSCRSPIKVPAGLRVVAEIRPTMTEEERVRRGCTWRFTAGIGLFPVVEDGAFSAAPALVFTGTAAMIGSSNARVADCPDARSARRTRMTVAPAVDPILVLALASEWDAHVAACTQHVRAG